MTPIVEVCNLRKTYGAVTAVDGISFEVVQGEVFGMVGPNGAGKTTTIECLEGLRKPDSGLVRVLGVDPQKCAKLIRQNTGMQLQQSNLPDRMKVWEALDLYSTFYPKSVDWRDLLKELGLEERRNTAFAKLSGGQKQRLFIAMALLSDPQLIFLDELTTGLDPQARRAIWDLVRAVRSKGKTILLTTHFMEEAERLCDRVAILDHGRIVALDTPAALVSTLSTEERVIFSVAEGLPGAFLGAMASTARVEVQGEQVTVHGLKNGAPLVVEVVQQLTTHGVRFRNLRTEQATLEDVFIKLTGREMRE